MTDVKVLPETNEKPQVFYYDYDSAYIILNHDAELFTHGIMRNIFKENIPERWQNCIMYWKIPTDFINDGINRLLNAIQPICSEIYDLYYGESIDDDDNIRKILNLKELITEIIDKRIDDRATIIYPDNCMDYFCNGETPEQILDYVSRELVHNGDYWVFFPCKPEVYYERAVMEKQP